MSRAMIAAGILGICAPAQALAQDSDDLPPLEPGWHGDAIVAADLPLVPDAFSDVTSFGGNLALRAWNGPLDLELDLSGFEKQNTMSDEVLTYRIRAMAGYRWYHRTSIPRSVVLRGLAGVELGGFEDTGGTGFVADEHRPGFAVAFAAESRTEIPWGIVITLSVMVAVSAQPFGDKDAGESRYVGLEFMPGIGVGF